MEFTNLFALYIAMSAAGAMGGFWRVVRNPLPWRIKYVILGRELLGGTLAGVMGGGIVTFSTYSVPWVVSISLLCGICYDEVFACGLNFIKRAVSTMLQIMKTGK